MKKIIKKEILGKEFVSFFILNLIFITGMTALFFIFGSVLHFSAKEELKGLVVLIYALIYGLLVYPLLNFTQFYFLVLGKAKNAVKDSASKLKNLQVLSGIYLSFFAAVVIYLILFLILGFIMLIFKNNLYMKNIFEGVLAAIGIILIYVANAYNRFYIYLRIKKEENDRAPNQSHIIPSRDV